jgi:hypothetical protein
MYESSSLGNDTDRYIIIVIVVVRIIIIIIIIIMLLVSMCNYSNNQCWHTGNFAEYSGLLLHTTACIFKELQTLRNVLDAVLCTYTCIQLYRMARK